MHSEYLLSSNEHQRCGGKSYLSIHLLSDVTEFSFRFLDHTADVKIEVEGQTLESCFKGASKAVFTFMLQDAKIAEKEQLDLDIKSENLEALLYDFIDKLLYHFYADDFIPSRYEELKIEQDKQGYVLHAMVIGDLYDPDTHGFIDEIKAMTYNEMHIADGIIRFVVDI